MYPVSWTVTEQSDTNVNDRINRFAARPFFAVVRADTRVLPKVVGDNYDGGRLVGRLVVARVDTGAPVCAIPISAESSPKVNFRTRGITGTTFEKAIQDDFRTQVTKAIGDAAKTAIPGYVVSN